MYNVNEGEEIKTVNDSFDTAYKSQNYIIINSAIYAVDRKLPV